MNRRVILALVALLLLVQAVSATILREDVAVWYDFKDGSGNFVTDEAGNASFKAYIKSGAGGTGWNMTDATRPSGLGGAYYISNATNQSIEIPDLAWNDTFTIVIVKKQTSVAVADMAFFGHGVNTGERVDYWWGGGTGTAGRGYVLATATADTSVGTGTPPEQWPGSWRMEVMRANSTKGLTLAEGNNATVNAKATTSFSTVPNPTGNMSIGKVNAALSLPQFNGNIAQFIIFRRYVTDAELTTLYNGGNYTTYDALFPPVVVTTFTVNVKDYLNASVVQSANVTLYNSSGVIYSNLSDASGNIVYSTNGTAPASLSFNVSKSGFFNLTGQTVTANVTANASLWQGRYLVSVTDPFDDSAVSSATVTFYDGSTATTNASGVAGFAGVYNGTKAFTTNKTGYFNASGSAVMNATTNVNLTVAEWTNLTVWSIITNSLLTSPFNVTVQGGKTYAYPFTNIYLRSGQMNFTWSKAGWYDLTFARNITALTNSTGNVSGAYNHNLTVQLFNSSGSLITSSANITITQANYSYSTVNATTTGIGVIGLLQNLSYLVSVSAEGFAYANATITPNTTAYTYNFTLYVTNTFNITIYDESTNRLITNETFTVEVIGDTYSQNYTTTGGTVEISLLVPSAYEIRYRSLNGSYSYPRSYFYTLTTGTYNNLRLYHVTDSESSYFIPRVVNQYGFYVENATIYLIRGQIENGSYPGYTVEMSRSDAEGNGLVRIVPNTVYYKLFITHPTDGSATTNYFKITASTKTFQITTTGDPMAALNAYTSMAKNLTFNSATNTFTFNWLDETGEVTSGCLVVRKTASNGLKTTVANSCSVASTGSIIYMVVDTANTTYSATGTITTGDGSAFTDTETHSYRSAYMSFGLLGVFLTAMIIIFLVMLAGNSAEAVVIIAAAGVVICGFIGLLAQDWTAVVGVVVIAGVLVFKMNRIG